MYGGLFAICKVKHYLREINVLRQLLYLSSLRDLHTILNDTVGREARRIRRTAASYLCPSMPHGGNRLPGTRFFPDRHEAHSPGARQRPYPQRTSRRKDTLTSVLLARVLTLRFDTAGRPRRCAPGCRGRGLATHLKRPCRALVYIGRGGSALAQWRRQVFSLRVLDGCNFPDPSGHSDFFCRKGRVHRTAAKQAMISAQNFNKNLASLRCSFIFIYGLRLKFYWKFLLRRFLNAP